MQVDLLGPLRVMQRNARIEVDAPMQRALLAVLAVRVGEVVSTDRLLDALWGDEQPAGGVKTLRYHVSKLRDALEPRRVRGHEGIVGTTPGGYVLRLDLDAVDSARFERMARDGERLLSDGSFRQAREVLGDALGLWRGGAFEDFRYDIFAQGEIARLEELRLLCFENRIDADLELGQHRVVVGELRELTMQFPLRERFWGQLMLALYRTDQQAEALAAYQTARAVLGEELGIEPNAPLRRLEQQILRQELPFEAPGTGAGRGDNLPVRIASFVGRTEDMNAVEEMVDNHRLVTATGFGGIGKTSLVTEVAGRFVDRYRDGAWLVELAPLSDPRNVVGEIAKALHVSEDPIRSLLDVVVEQLASWSALVVIDNCEHLIDEAARVIRTLLEGCPALRILATSREPLGIPGEQVWSVPPLGLPAPGTVIPAVEAIAYDAVRLFCERARESATDFELGEANVTDVVEVCRRLDGIPLALELAAARLSLLSPRDLLDRLDDRFRLLADGGRGRPHRHQTLLATMEWSFDLLSAQEQNLLGRLAVFDGGFTLAAAEEVCSDGGRPLADVAALMGGLVDASLVTATAREPRRFGMLETVRHYALALLVGSGEEATLRRRHADYYAGLFPRHPDFDTAEMAEMLDQLAIEEANFRGALAWTVESEDADRALVLASRLSLHWFFSAQPAEAAHWVPLVLGLVGAAPSIERARLLHTVAVSAAWSGQTPQALATAEELARIAEELGNQSISDDSVHLTSECLLTTGDLRKSRQVLVDHASPDNSIHLAHIGYASVLLGDFDDAADSADRLERLAATRGQAGAMAMTFAATNRGLLAHYRGDLATARRLHEGALGEMRRLGRDAVQSEELSELAQICLATDEIEEAEDWARQSIKLGTRNAVSFEIADGYTQLARVELRRGLAADASAAAAIALEYAPHDACALAAVVAVTAQLAFARGAPIESAVLHAGAEQLRRAIGFVHPLPRKHELDHELAEVRAMLDPDAYEAARLQGASLTSQELLSRAKDLVSSTPTGR